MVSCGGIGLLAALNGHDKVRGQVFGGVAAASTADYVSMLFTLLVPLREEGSWKGLGKPTGVPDT